MYQIFYITQSLLGLCIFPKFRQFIVVMFYGELPKNLSRSVLEFKFPGPGKKHSSTYIIHYDITLRQFVKVMFYKS